MKTKKVRYVLVTLVVLLSLFMGCKKDKEENVELSPKDVANLFHFSRISYSTEAYEKGYWKELPEKVGADVIKEVADACKVAYEAYEKGKYFPENHKISYVKYDCVNEVFIVNFSLNGELIPGGDEAIVVHKNTGQIVKIINEGE